jgi:hypothetical protein
MAQRTAQDETPPLVGRRFNFGAVVQVGRTPRAQQATGNPGSRPGRSTNNFPDGNPGATKKLRQMHTYNEPAAHGKPEQGAPFGYFAAHDVQARARELLDPNAEPAHGREWWAAEAVRRGSECPSVLALQADVIVSCGLTWDDMGRVA